ncbi:MAG: autotransporter outer membrane beta-barrel domain-containing protein [Acidaminococcaceae bacterium]|nr:autotransporter outer membrane beta-barrel domain-containing protein [Acidaminococcaceae bacterium]
MTLTDADSSDTNLSGSKVAVQGRLNGALNIGNNDKLVLLANNNAEITTDVNTELQSGEIMQGVSVIYDYTAKMSDDNKQVLAEFTNGRVSVNSQSPIETRLAAAAFLNSGADLLADKGIADIAEIADDSIFGVMSGGSIRYDTGSHADVKGYNLAMGFGKVVTNNASQLLTFGSFIEYGYGNYTSHLDSGIRADGNTKYYGIGLLARQDNNDGVYYEGSLRYGRMDADYASGDLIGVGGSKVFADYDSSSSYYGAHLGIGKVNKINDTTKVDLYAKLFYTHQGGDSVTLGGEGNGEVYDFNAVDSTRARVGARLSKDYGERSSGYVGVAYEYEFDGEARATVKGLSTPAPSIKGSSGLLEVGYILQPKGINDLMINIGLQGWGGKKAGRQRQCQLCLEILSEYRLLTILITVLGTDWYLYHSVLFLRNKYILLQQPTPAGLFENSYFICLHCRR